MISIGPLPQNHDRASAENLLVTIGPLTLSVRPLSPYQQTLIDTIFHLRFTGWNDSQIANHFNDAGYLTPRGHQWFPQSVFSMRKKYQSRLERLGGTQLNMHNQITVNWRERV